MVKKQKLPLVVIALGLGLFMTMLDSTIVNISIPAMMDDFGVNVSTISWVLDAYLLTLAVLALTMGRLADQFGRKLIYLSGLSVFTVGSLLCALSWNMGWLIGFRVLQGIGGAVMIPVTMALLTAAFPVERRGTAMGVWAAIGITAAAVGPSLGGVIVEHLDWRWVFYINLPIGALAVALSWWALAESRDPASPKRLDLLGLGTFCAGVLALVLAAIKGQEWGWGSAVIISLFVASALFMALFVLCERRQKEPMLDLRLFRSMTFSSAAVAQALVAFGMLGAMFLLTLFLQRVLGYSVLRAAVAVTPIPASALVFAPLAGRLSDKVDVRIPAVVGTLALAVGVCLFTGLDVDSTWGDVAWRAVIVGGGIGLSNAPLAAAAMGSTPAGKEGVGSGVLNTSRLVGMTLGVAIVTALLTGSVSTHVATAKTEALAIVAEDSQLPEQAKASLSMMLARVDVSTGPATMPDIATLAKERGVPSLMLPQLEQLSQRVALVFKTHLTEAFSGVFVWAGALSALGLIPAMLLRRPRSATQAGSVVTGETDDGTTE